MDRTEWTKIPTGLYVSTGLMKRFDNGIYSLTYPGDAERDEHNSRAGEIKSIALKTDDCPITMMNKRAALLGLEDGSRIPTLRELDESMAYVALAKAMGVDETGLYESWRRRVLATSDILEAHGKAGDMHRMTLWRYVGGVPEPVEDILIPDVEGWIETVGMHGYPTRISRNECPVQNFMNLPGFAELPLRDASRYWCPGDPPANGEKRITVRTPPGSSRGSFVASLSDGLSHSSAHVAAIRVRNGTPVAETASG